MKKDASIKLLGLIFVITILFEILTWVLGAPPEKSIVRLIGLAGVFLWLINGSRFARYTLSVVYFLSAFLAALSVGRSGETATFMVLYSSFSMFSFASAIFFFRSNVLRALTGPVRLTTE